MSATQLAVQAKSTNRRYYHTLLENFYRFVVPPNMRVLQVGNRHKYLLDAVQPAYGVQTSDVSQINQEIFDYIILSHTTMDVDDVQAVLQSLKPFCSPSTRVVIDTYNYLWEPILNGASKLKLAAPQRSRHWLSQYDLVNLLNLADFEVVTSGQDMLLPVNIPGVSWFFNNIIGPAPIINKLCLSSWIIARPGPSTVDFDLSDNRNTVLPAMTSTSAHSELIEESERENDLEISVRNNIRQIADTGILGRKIEGMEGDYLPPEDGRGVRGGNGPLAKTCDRELQNKTTPTVSVIVPCRNEKGNIEAAITRTPKMGAHTEFIFVEGHSKDGTLEEIKRVAEIYTNHDITYFVQSGKGKGNAVREAFARAKGDVLMILDADLTMPPEELPKFYDAIVSGKGEFINGSRLIYGMEDQAMRFLNLLANHGFSLIFTWLLNQRVKDTLCGTKVLFRKDYERIAQARHFFGDFDPYGDFDLLFGAAKQNLKIIDMPVHYKARTYGTSQISRFSGGVLLTRMSLIGWRKFKWRHKG